jgi:hypothetical protein
MISFFRRAMLLAASSGISFVLYVHLGVRLMGYESKGPFTWPDYLELQSLFILASIMCTIFGAPFLYLIDKYCPKWRFRYVLGGALAGWFMWLILASPLFRPRLWFELEQWYLNYDNWSLVSTSAGLYTGIVYSIALWCIERWSKQRANVNPT